MLLEKLLLDIGFQVSASTLCSMDGSRQLYSKHSSEDVPLMFCNPLYQVCYLSKFSVHFLKKLEPQEQPSISGHYLN